MAGFNFDILLKFLKFLHNWMGLLETMDRLRRAINEKIRYKNNDFFRGIHEHILKYFESTFRDGFPIIKELEK